MQTQHKSLHPFAKMKEWHDYFKRCLYDMEELYVTIGKLIEEAGDTYHLSTADYYHYLELQNKRNQLEGQINNTRYMVDIYDTRIQNYLPIFEKESAEANANWDSVYEKSQKLAEVNPLSIFGLLLKDHKDSLGQEHKNELYKALKKQLEFYEQSKNGLKIR